jgi:hypothetical protein
MMFRAALSFVIVCCLSACGSGTTSVPAAAAPIAGKPDVIITFDRANHACVVALYTEPQGSTIPCADLVPFLKDELRLPSGSIYDTRTSGTGDDADAAKITRSLNEAGYRFIGGH